MSLRYSQELQVARCVVLATLLLTSGCAIRNVTPCRFRVQLLVAHLFDDVWNLNRVGCPPLLSPFPVSLSFSSNLISNLILLSVALSLWLQIASSFDISKRILHLAHLTVPSVSLPTPICHSLLPLAALAVPYLTPVSLWDILFLVFNVRRL